MVGSTTDIIIISLCSVSSMYLRGNKTTSMLKFLVSPHGISSIPLREEKVEGSMGIWPKQEKKSHKRRHDHTGLNEFACKYQSLSKSIHCCSCGNSNKCWDVLLF